MSRDNQQYTPYYCEENIWQLCRQPQFSGMQAQVLFISNAAQQCPFWWQKRLPPEQPVWWDYHVILAVKAAGWMVYDFEAALPFPTALQKYFARTFQFIPAVESRVAPQFKIIPADEYSRDFYSDRMHMKNSTGEWLAPPPDWPLITGSKKLPLAGLLDFTATSPHEIFSLHEILDQFNNERSAL